MITKTRFAPSPTGVLHIGSVRTALFSWLHARHTGGRFILRIEDTDRERSTLENVDAILDGLRWLGLDADEGPYFQTRRFDRYRAVAEDWLAAGKAYYCYCSREELEAMREAQMAGGEKMRYDGRCRERQEPRPGVTPVVRFRNPETGDVVVDDLVRGRVVFRNEELDDLIILRSDGTPTYNFCVVIDDFDMAVTHVIRGDDHLNNTPRQMNMLGALGVRPPVYAHLPMILGPDGAKLSKRHGAVDIRDYREQGYLPEALLNYIVRLGWSHGDRELFSVDEMIALFDVAEVNQSASAFNPEKLRWLNQQHIITAPGDTLGARLESYIRTAGMDPANGPPPQAVANAYRERAETLVQMAESARYLYEDFEAFDAAAAKKHLRPVVRQPLQDVRTAFADLDTWQPAAISAAIERVAAAHELGLGKLGQPIRVAVTGSAVSPPIDVTVHLVGQQRAVDRIDRALDYIGSRGTATA
jgi:glutamyl-tRNA synthetase